MNKEDIIDQYVKELTAKMDNMAAMFGRTSLTDRKHMETVLDLLL